MPKVCKTELSGMTAVVNALQPLNALASITSVFAGIFTCSRAVQPSKAFAPIFVKPFGNCMDFKPVFL